MNSLKYLEKLIANIEFVKSESVSKTWLLSELSTLVSLMKEEENARRRKGSQV